MQPCLLIPYDYDFQLNMISHLHPDGGLASQKDVLCGQC